MRSSLTLIAQNSVSSLIRRGTRRLPRPTMFVPRPGRRAPARLSTTVTKIGLTHANRSPKNPVHFTGVLPRSFPPRFFTSVPMTGFFTRVHTVVLSRSFTRWFSDNRSHGGFFTKGSSPTCANNPRMRPQRADPWTIPLRTSVENLVRTSVKDLMRPIVEEPWCEPSWRTPVRTMWRTPVRTIVENPRANHRGEPPSLKRQ
jgi:hypothetical protein